MSIFTAFKKNAPEPQPAETPTYEKTYPAVNPALPFLDRGEHGVDGFYSAAVEGIDAGHAAVNLTIGPEPEALAQLRSVQAYLKVMLEEGKIDAAGAPLVHCLYAELKKLIDAQEHLYECQRQKAAVHQEAIEAAEHAMRVLHVNRHKLVTGVNDHDHLMEPAEEAPLEPKFVPVVPAAAA